MAGDRGPLRTAIENWWKDWNPSKRFSDWVSESVEKVEQSILNAIAGDMKVLDEIPEVPAALKPSTYKKGDKRYQGGVMGILGFGAQMGMSAASGLLSPIMRVLNYWMDSKIHSARFDPSVMIAHERRQALDYPTLPKDIEELGWTQDRWNIWRQVMASKLSLYEYIALWRRGEMNDGQLRLAARAIGYDDDELAGAKKVSMVIPGVQDLINMQVREGWNDIIAARFEYDKGDKEQVKIWAAKQGLDPSWVDIYWRVHWQLPGVSMGIEMVHRLRDGELAFTEEDLDLLMAANDIPPFFRKRILAVSEALFTRVDIRRLFQAGLFPGGVDDVIGAYRDLGYGPERAQALAEFAIRGVSEDEKDLTRADIVGAYVDGILDGGEAKGNLVKMGYDGAEADIIIARADLDIAKKELSAFKEYIKQRFQRQMITDIEAKGELGKYGLKAETIDGLILSWTREKKLSTTMPTQSKAETWYIKDIITLEKYIEYLMTLNYAEEEIGYLLLDADRKRKGGASVETEVTT